MTTIKEAAGQTAASVQTRANDTAIISFCTRAKVALLRFAILVSAVFGGRV